MAPSDRPQGNVVSLVVFYFFLGQFYNQRNELALLLVNIWAAMLQIGRLFTTPALLHAKVDNKCQEKVLNIDHNMVLRGPRKAKIFLGRSWDCGKTFEKVCRLLHPHPSPFSRLASGLTISSDGVGANDWPLAVDSQLLKWRNSRQLSVTTFY